MEKPKPSQETRVRYQEAYKRAETFMPQLPENRDREFDNVYRNFFALTGIPRQSTKEHLVGDFLEVGGVEKGYMVERDSVGNVLWRVPASSPEYATVEASFVAQTHQDMVCKGNPSPAEHGVVPEVFERDGSWFIRSKDNATTLGADDGIMLSFAMELPDMLKKKGIPHGEIGLLFTIDEEDGLNGAKALQFNLNRYGTYLNLDSEWDQEITIGSAATGYSSIDLPVERIPVNPGSELIQVTASGLKGGHSGVEIGDNTRQNAIKLLTQVARNTQSEGVSLGMVAAEAMDPMNAIPNKATFTFAVSQDGRTVIEKVTKDLQESLTPTEKEGATITVATVNQPHAQMLDAETTENLLMLLHNLPHGVVAWQESDPTQVKTSTNLARIHLGEDGMAAIHLMSRSSDNQAIEHLRRQTIEGIAKSHGATITHTEASPAWEPIPDSDLALLINSVNERLYGNSMKQTITHGGLETSHIVQLYPHFSGRIVSIGANVNHAHEEMEETEGPSVERVGKLTLEVIGEIARLGKQRIQRRAA